MIYNYSFAYVIRLTYTILWTHSFGYLLFTYTASCASPYRLQLYYYRRAAYRGFRSLLHKMCLWYGFTMELLDSLLLFTLFANYSHNSM